MSNKVITKDTIISIDIETTGLTVGINSMIALGAVAYRNGVEIAHFYGALQEDPDTERSAGTMEFWQKNLAEWKRIRKEARPPADVMNEFVTWVDSLPGPHVLAGNPSAFDSGFIFHYLHKFVGEEVVGQLFKRSRALDIRTFIAALFGVPYSEAERTICPEEWTESLPYTHNALDDARNQGVLLMHLLKASVGELEMGA
jgi:DNA polymerase III alpha subunit (gram-positive type)